MIENIHNERSVPYFTLHRSLFLISPLLIIHKLLSHLKPFSPGYLTNQRPFTAQPMFAGLNSNLAFLHIRKQTLLVIYFELGQRESDRIPRKMFRHIDMGNKHKQGAYSIQPVHHDEHHKQTLFDEKAACRYKRGPEDGL
ncbi:hypothetical protein BYT27DRAFT_6938557 [Phlegmacium glaucopus]|nr:hypothetical protein BYT27DRAFT_6938557 [Phlegmacium glaucopus]